VLAVAQRPDEEDLEQREAARELRKRAETDHLAHAAAQVHALADQGAEEAAVLTRVADEGQPPKLDEEALAWARLRADQQSRAVQVSAEAARRPAVTAERGERDPRVGAPRKRATLGIAGALVLIALVALAVLSSRFAQRPTEPAPVPTLQIDKTLR
jgi:hypothetical protein